MDQIHEIFATAIKQSEALNINRTALFKIATECNDIKKAWDIAREAINADHARFEHNPDNVSDKQ